MDLRISNPIVGAPTVGAGEGLREDAAHRAAAAFNRRPWRHGGTRRRGVGRDDVLAADWTVIWGAGLEKALLGAATGPDCGCWRLSQAQLRAIRMLKTSSSH